MKSKTFTFATTLSLLATLAIPVYLAAQDTATQNHAPKHHHYKLIDLGTLGGPNSSVTFGGYTSKTLDSQGTVVGFSDTSTTDPYCLLYPDCFVNRSFQWRNGISTDLGALPGLNNSFAFGFNSRGWVVGVSESGAIDPLTGFRETNAVLWRNGQIINLGTLGGNASGANAVNNQGQVVGGALTTIPDLFSDVFSNTYFFELYGFYLFPGSTESHAFLWQEGKMNDLGTLGGPDSVAWFVNERGQVAGQSTIDSIANSTTLIPTVDPFFWDHGKMVDVGNLGGTYGYVIAFNDLGQMTGSMTLAGDVSYHPFFWSRGVLTDLGTFGGNCGEAHALNDAGEVVGWSGSCQTFAFAFLWKNGVMTDLGTVDGDPCSASDGINAKGQVVGESSPSCFSDPTQQEGFLWENEGPAVDLNTLISPNSGMVVTTGFSISDRGEINGNGLLPNGDQHAILLIPCDESHADLDDCDYNLVEATSMAAQIRPAQIPQAQATSPAKLSLAEKMTRFPSLRAGRNRRYGAPQTSPQ